MGRRVISAKEEQQLIADAEGARDSGPPARPSQVKVAADVSAVLSVRVPIDQLRAIRRLAAERDSSLSALLQEAIEQLLTNRGPRVSYSHRVTRLFVTGATAEVLGDNFSETTVTSPELASTW